ncbi:MAG: hypothetical protein ACM3O4_04035 [Ignavibacteriales bacterium]
MDIVILMALIGFVVFFFKRFVNVIYLIPIVDIFLRILAVIKEYITDPQFYAFIDKWFPANIPSIIGKYTSGFIYDVFFWIYIAVYIIFEYYIIREFFSGKK